MISFSDEIGGGGVPSLGTGLEILNGPAGELFKQCLAQALEETKKRPAPDKLAATGTKEYRTAVAALEMFLARPGSNAAAEALIALCTWDGPVSSHFLARLLPLLNTAQRTKLLTAGLEIYISAGGKGV